MKKSFLLFVFVIIQTVLVSAQGIDTTNNIITINPAGAKYDLLQQAQKTIPGASAVQNTKHLTKIWLESGTGFFTTNPLIAYPVSGVQSHIPFMLSTNTYDTTKNPPTSIVFQNMNFVNTGGNNSFSQILNDVGVKITPNNFDIVPGDFMAFALTYKTYSLKNDPVKKQDSLFKLYFFYNNNRSFLPVSQTRKDTVIGSNPVLNFCRTHNGETPNYDPRLPNSSINNQNFQHWICYSIPRNDDFEKTVFVSMLPFGDLEIGKSGSVYAVLTDNAGNTIGTDIISNMPFSPAHDPNYLVQQPFCLLLPKKEYPFNYTVHFQNTGAGDATEVKVVVHLPKGLDPASLTLKKASFAGEDYTATIKSKPFKVIGDSLEIIFISSGSRYLKGTINSSSPSTDPQTMGDVLFTIKSTPNTDDSLKAYANIYFRSEHPSSNIDKDGYEQPVTTNIAVTRYKDCCDCITPVPPICYKIFGLCWWWWLIIIAVLVILWWFIIAKRKKEKEKPQMINDSLK